MTLTFFSEINYKSMQDSLAHPLPTCAHTRTHTFTHTHTHTQILTTPPGCLWCDQTVKGVFVQLQ